MKCLDRMEEAALRAGDRLERSGRNLDAECNLTVDRQMEVSMSQRKWRMEVAEDG